MSLADAVKRRQRRVDVRVPHVGKPAGKVWMLIASERDWSAFTAHADRPTAEAELQNLLEWLEEPDERGAWVHYSNERIQLLMREARRGPIVLFGDLLVEIKVAYMHSLWERPARKPRRAKVRCD